RPGDRRPHPARPLRDPRRRRPPRQPRARRRARPPLRRAPPMTDRYQEVMKVRRAVLGDEHVDRATANATDFTRPFQEFITRGAWVEVWTREELDRRTRSVITLSVLIALRAENEIGMHIKGALRNGLTPEEIRE